MLKYALNLHKILTKDKISELNKLIMLKFKNKLFNLIKLVKQFIVLHGNKFNFFFKNFNK